MEVSFSVIFIGQPVVSQNTYSSEGNTDSDFSLVRFLETLFKPWNHWWGWVLKPHKIGRGLYYFAIFTLHFYRYHLLSSTGVCLGWDWAVNYKDRRFCPGSSCIFTYNRIFEDWYWYCRTKCYWIVISCFRLYILK